MGLFVGVVAQKGGVGKSTIATMLAREYAATGWQVKIADLDNIQFSCVEWAARRIEHGVQPEIRVELFSSVRAAVSDGQHQQLMVLDGAAHASMQTKDIAEASDLLIIPSSVTLKDLNPNIRLAHELVQKHDVPMERIAFALSRVPKSPKQLADAQDYIRQTPYHLLPGYLRLLPAFSAADDLGQTPLESPYRTATADAAILAKGIVERLAELTQKGEAANEEDREGHAAAGGSSSTATAADVDDDSRESHNERKAKSAAAG